ncbi:cadherin repeat domain-containing protein [Nitrospira lenta]|uniref:cadherin repeat domain-containing protein n=1 Tax=Nitrospira lenta TaxID=1436998 RepID=UPI0015E89A4B|nr:cadherin repeat domain-containing protein [Nitrospira lenta]
MSLSTGALSGSTLDLTQPVLVDIDLTGITAGAGARFSFDLLGFGDRTSTIVLDNVLLTNGHPTAAPVAVNDAYTVAEGATVTLTITPTNDAPVIAPMAAQTVEQGRTLTVHVVATDPGDSNSAPESTVLTYRLAPGASSGTSIDANIGVLSWAVPRTQTVGRYTIAVIVTDAGTPVLSATRRMTVDVKELTTTPPTLHPIGPKVVNEEAELRLTMAATYSDLPAQPLGYRATGLPAGARFNATARGASAELTVRLVPDKVTHLAGRCRDGLTSDLDAYTADGLSLDRARPYRVPRSLAG